MNNLFNKFNFCEYTGFEQLQAMQADYSIAGLTYIVRASCPIQVWLDVTEDTAT